MRRIFLIFALIVWGAVPAYAQSGGGPSGNKGHGTFTTPITTAGITDSGTIAATNLTASGTATFSGTGTGLAVTNNATIGGTLTINPLATNPLAINNGALALTGTGNASLSLKALGTGSINFYTQGGTNQQFQISDTLSSVNWIKVQGGLTGTGPTLSVANDTTANLNLTPGATGFVKAGGLGLQAPVFYLNANKTYANGSPINNVGPNYASIWQNQSYSGSYNSSGSSTIDFLAFTDTIATDVANREIIPVGILHNLNSGWSGFRQALSVQENVNAASALGSGALNTIGFFTHYGSLGNQLSEGGTGNPTDASTWKGYVVGINPDTTCNVLYGLSCEVDEHDMRNLAPVLSKKIMILGYAVNDAAHGVDDCALCIGAAASIPTGTGKGLNIIELGGITSAWPIDGTNSQSCIMCEIPQTVGNQGAGYPNQGSSYYGWDFPGVYYNNYSFRVPGFWLDGAGQPAIGPTNITYDATGAYWTANNFEITSVTVNAAGSGYVLHDYVYDQYGDIFDVDGVTAGAITHLTFKRNGFTSNCTGLTGIILNRGFGKGGTVNLACGSAANQITLGGTGQTVNLGASAHVSAGGAVTATSFSGDGSALTNLPVPIGASGVITTSQTLNLPAGWHSVQFKEVGGGGGSGCGIVQAAGTTASGGGTGGTANPVTGIFFSSVTGGTQIVISIGAAGSSCVASGTATGSTGSTPTAGGNTTVTIGSYTRTAFGGGAGANGQSAANAAGGGGSGWAAAGGNASGATAGGAGAGAGCVGSNSGGGTVAAYPDGCMGGTGDTTGLAGATAGASPTVGIGAGGSGGGLAATPVALNGGGGRLSVYSGGGVAGAGGLSTCTGTSQNGGNAPAFTAGTGSELSGSGGGGGASCTTGQAGGNGGAASGYGASGGGGGATQQDGTHLAGSGGASTGGAVWYLVN